MTRAFGARTIERAIDIPASAEWLFDLTQDYARRLAWDPFLSKAELYAETAGVGVRAWCVSKLPPMGMETEYVTFQRPDVVAIKMTKGPLLLRRFAGSWRFQPRGELTRVIFRYRFETRPSVIAPLAARVFAYDMTRRLRGLRAYAERSSVPVPVPR